jgi:S1-C subfamily serine protease
MRLYIFIICLVKINLSIAQLPDFVFATQNSLEAVVHINSKEFEDQYYKYYDPFLGNLYFNKPNEKKSSGSGVIISEDGFIVTNYHVIESATEIEVTLNNKDTYRAEFIAADPNTDIALLKIKTSGLRPIKFYNSDLTRVGEWVLAVGNPYNLTSTVTAGIISAKGRNINILHNPNAVESFIQTDAVINPGNSGGALVNINGELVGLNTAIKSPTGSYTGYGFSIPSNLVESVVKDLKEFGFVKRAFIGVQVQNITNYISEKYDLDSNQGVLITKVVDDGAASQSGILDFDVILSIDNVKVNSVNALQEKICQYDSGDIISCLIKRNTREIKIQVTLR